MSACCVFALFLALSGSAWDGNDEWPGSCCHRRSQFCANCSEAIIRVSQTWHPDTHQSPGKTDDADVKKLKTPNPEARMVTSVYHIWSWPGERLYNAMRQISLLIIQVVITINIHDCVTLCWQALSLSLWNHFLVSLSQKSLVICPCPRVDGKSGKPVSDPLCTLWIRSRQKSAGAEL